MSSTYPVLLSCTATATATVASVVTSAMHPEADHGHGGTGARQSHLTLDLIKLPDSGPRLTLRLTLTSTEPFFPLPSLPQRESLQSPTEYPTAFYRPHVPIVRHLTTLYLGERGYT